MCYDVMNFIIELSTHTLTRSRHHSAHRAHLWPFHALLPLFSSSLSHFNSAWTQFYVCERQFQWINSMNDLERWNFICCSPLIRQTPIYANARSVTVLKWHINSIDSDIDLSISASQSPSANPPSKLTLIERTQWEIIVAPRDWLGTYNTQ